MVIAERGMFMTQPSRSVSQRIRTVKSSLDNAEQSFLDNKDIRGELDLMLAEAELKNLRRKKDLPWSWNRHILAICAASLLAVAGLSGWYIAKDHYREAAAAKAKNTVTNSVSPQPSDLPVAQASITPQAVQTNILDNNADVKPAPKKAENRAVISKAEMHQLVQSARVELSNSK